MRKKWKNAAAVGMAAVMAAGALAGCGTRATPENLFRDMKKNVASAESSLMNLQMSIVMSVESYEAAVAIDMDVESVAEPEAAHGKGSVDMSVAGMDFSTEIESYSVLEGEEYMVYSMVDDMWTKETQNAEELTGSLEDLAEAMEFQADRFELAEELSEVNGQECFQLVGELDMSFVSEMMDSGMMNSDMMDSLGEYGLDEETLAGLTFPCTIDIYRENILPAKISIDMTDAMGTALAGAGTSVSECSLDMTYMEYDSVGEIMVPDEVISAATEESGDDDGADLWEVPDTSAGDPDISGGVSGMEGTGWESYTVQINGREITLPCSIAEIENAGLSLDEDYTPRDSVIDAEDYETAWFMDDAGNSIMTDISNTSADGPKTLEDCVVTSVYVFDYDLEYGGLTVVFPGGIQIGSAKSDVVSAYGEPDSTYENDEYGDSYFWFNEDFNGCTINFTPDTETVSSMSLS